MLQNTPYFVRKFDMLKQNSHYFWNQLPKMSKKEVLALIQHMV